MGGTFLRGIDPAALLFVMVVVAVAALIAGRAVYRHRRKFQRWLRSVTVKKRLDVIVRDLDRLVEYVGDVSESEPAAWRPFEQGLAAMPACRWDEAIGHFETAQTRVAGTDFAPLLNQIGVCHYMQGRLGDALRGFQESVRLAEQREDKRGRASALNNIGVILHEYGELDLSLKNLTEARALARESGNQAAEALCLGNIGNVLHDKGEHNAALKSQEDALAMSRRIGDEQGVACSQANIGGILRDKGESDKALEHYAEAVETARKIAYKLGTAIGLCNIGSLYHDKGELDRALMSHESALALSHEIGYRLGVATELGNIGLILTSKRMHERAVSYLAESLGFFLAAGAANGPRQALYGLSKCDDLLGRERTHGLLNKAGLTNERIADTLDRIDQIRSRRPWQMGKHRHPFAPVAR
jgi:tetratricopeptide (TPR) repeat protein